MIMRAMEKSLPWSEMRGVLDRLSAAIESFDCKRSVALLSEAVPEYQPTESLRDHVWTSKAGKAGAPATGDSKVTSLRAHRAHLESVPSAGRQKLRPVEGLSPQAP